MVEKRKRSERVAAKLLTTSQQTNTKRGESTTLQISEEDDNAMQGVITSQANDIKGSIVDQGVDEVIRGLYKMENKLRSAVKKQRRDVEDSNLSCKTEFEAKALAGTELPRRGILTIENGNGQKVKAKRVVKARNQTKEEAEDVTGNVEQDNSKDKEEGVDRGARRPPAVNSDTLPLPWSGRLGYACLNTYLRNANPPVFSSRTCRISSILDHRYPLQDPTQPEHPTKNRPDKTKEPDVERGLRYVQELGLANARDIAKMIRWNDKYGINFMRLSSEMFPFASHDVYGYKLAPFASDVLQEAGRVAGQLGHRLTTHPGQYTQIASPRKEVVTASIRDLEYHDEMLSLLRLPEQLDRDAVMILHMGGVYGDKAATVERFKENYKSLSPGVKKRLVLENDDVAWSVHDLLPVCEELNIPLVLDFHHHNIIFDPSIREGTADILQFYDRIRQTWTRKNITQKMHYSEPTAGAVTPRDRRKHSARVKTLPPCAPDMDLMIEAKDKEQAVFELMRTFKLPGWDRFNNIVPFERDDELKSASKTVTKDKKKQLKKSRNSKSSNGKSVGEEEQDGNGDDANGSEVWISAEEFGMGGPEGRVYWPEGMEEWLKPKKREVKKEVSGAADEDDDEE